MTEEYTSVHPHGLECTNNPRGWSCDTCDQHRTEKQASYRCKACNYDMCFDCLDKYRLPKHKGHEHPLVPTPYTDTSRGWSCDVCEAHFNAGSTRYHCHKNCNWDCCENCIHPKTTTTTTTTTTAVVAPGYFVTIHPHALEGKFNERGWTCDNCDNHYEADNAVHRCAQCNWDICFKCYSEYQMPLVPDHEHRLTPCAYDAKLGWSCDVCNASKPAGKRYHCAQGCNYDLCDVCALGYRGRLGFLEHSSGLVLDAKGGSAATHTELILWNKKMPPCNNQLWRFDYGALRSAMNDRQVVDIKGGDKAVAGSPIQLYPYHGKANQRWKMEGAAVVSEFRSLVLEPSGGVSKAGTKVTVAAHNGGAPQQWKFVAI